MTNMHNSYTEGIAVLYGTNTIHISGKSLISRIPKFILPQRLSMITALEIIWPLDIQKNEGGIWISSYQSLTEILKTLEVFFPKLCRLYLALKIDVSKIISLDEASFDLEEALGLLDAFMAQKSQLEYFTVGISKRPFEQLFGTVRDASSSDDPSKLPGQFLNREYWRFLGGRAALVPIVRNPESHKMPLKLEVDGATSRSGYWVVMGDTGPRPLYTVGCGDGMPR